MLVSNFDVFVCMTAVMHFGRFFSIGAVLCLTHARHQGGSKKSGCFWRGRTVGIIVSLGLHLDHLYEKHYLSIAVFFSEIIKFTRCWAKAQTKGHRWARQQS